MIPLKYLVAKIVNLHFPNVKFPIIPPDCVDLVETMRQVKICEHLLKEYPIIYAIQLGFYKAFVYYINVYHAFIEESMVVNDHSYNITILATRGNNLQIVRYLCETKKYDFSRLLHFKHAIQNKNIQMLKYLFIQYPGTPKHSTLTRIAISEGNLLILKYLIKKNISLYQIHLLQSIV